MKQSYLRSKCAKLLLIPLLALILTFARYGKITNAIDITSWQDGIILTYDEQIASELKHKSRIQEWEAKIIIDDEAITEGYFFSLDNIPILETADGAEPFQNSSRIFFQTYLYTDWEYSCLEHPNKNLILCYQEVESIHQDEFLLRFSGVDPIHRIAYVYVPLSTDSIQVFHAIQSFSSYRFGDYYFGIFTGSSEMYLRFQVRAFISWLKIQRAI